MELKYLTMEHCGEHIDVEYLILPSGNVSFTAKDLFGESVEICGKEFLRALNIKESMENNVW